MVVIPTTSFMKRLVGNCALGPLLFLLACGAHIRRDPSEPAVFVNYPSVEFYACGQHFVGLGSCNIRPGERLDSVSLRIQGILDGEITVFSENGAVHNTIRYRGSERVRIPLPQRALEPVLIAFSMNPEIPGERDQGVRIWGARGFLWIAVHDGPVGHFQTKIPMRSNAIIDLPTMGADAIRIEGCGLDGRTLEPNGMFTRLRSNVLGMADVMAGCVYQIGVAYPSGRFEVHDWMVWKYASRIRREPPERNGHFLPLAEPTLSLNEGTLKVQADPSVTLIAMDRQYVIGHQADFQWSGEPVTIRLFTVKGRILVGDWTPETDWQWLR